MDRDFIGENWKNIYEKRMSQAEKEINISPSSPEAVILENLTGYTSIQLERISRLADGMEEKLINLAGFYRKKRHITEIYAEVAGVTESFLIPACQKFEVGGVCFESEKSREISGTRLVGVYMGEGENIIDCSFLLKDNSNEEYMTLEKLHKNGTETETETEIYFVFDRLPRLDRELEIYVQCGEDKINQTNSKEQLNKPQVDKCQINKSQVDKLQNDNDKSKVDNDKSQNDKLQDDKIQDDKLQNDKPQNDKLQNDKSQNDYKELDISWQYYTSDGYKPLTFTDNTNKFTQSGKITFYMGENDAEKTRLKFMENYGYVIKGIFAGKAENPPIKINHIKGAVLTLVQRETKAYIYELSGQTEYYIYSDLMEEQYVTVYCRKEGERLYTKCSEGEYEKIRQDYGRYCFRFKKPHESAVLAVYSDSAAGSFELGYTYGYDNEEFKLPFKNIIKSSFSVILEITLENGEKVYDIVRPDVCGAFGFTYELDEEAGVLRVKSVGECAGSKLYMGQAAVSQTADGVLLKGTELIPSGYETEVRFFNVADTEYGGKQESLGELKKRFAADVYKSYMAVTAEDYEDIVMGISAVNPQKVKAVGSSGENKVTVAVYIKGMKRGERISETVKAVIMKELNKRRLLSTRVELAEPVFALVNVNAVIAVKNRYEHCDSRIRKAIENLTDYIGCEKNFGDLLLFEEVYGSIQDLPCVSRIISLNISPLNYGHVSVQGLDIKPDDNCLLATGDIKLTLNYERDEKVSVNL